MTTPSAPNVGDVVYLSQAVAKMLFYGVVTDPSTPDQFAASMELSGDQGVVTMPVLAGERGPAGQPCFALRLQTDMSVNDPSDFPKNLTNTVADIGKYYILDDVDNEGHIIGSSAYVWFGTAWRRLQMGSPGPPGPVPIITPSVELVQPGSGSTVVTSGSAWQPSWHLKLDVPEGPPGPSATINSAPDTDFQTRTPQPGDVLGFTGKYTRGGDPVWVPVSISSLIPSPFSVPQSSFQAYGGLATNSQDVPIGNFALPPQPFPWTPIVWGHFKVSGLQFDKDPLLIGAEVRLGSINGAVVGRGYGGPFSSTNVMPHYSTPQTPSTAISPGNGRAVVPAYHSNPAQGTLYVSLINEGVAIGQYTFDPEDAQLFVLVVPIEAPLAG